MPIIVFCCKGIGYKATQKQIDRFDELESIYEDKPNLFTDELDLELKALIKEIQSKKPIKIDYLVTGDFA
jgi:phage regulator Rha-like protein